MFSSLTSRTATPCVCANACAPHLASQDPNEVRGPMHVPKQHMCAKTNDTCAKSCCAKACCADCCVPKHKNYTLSGILPKKQLKQQDGWNPKCLWLSWADSVLELHSNTETLAARQDCCVSTRVAHSTHLPVAIVHANDQLLEEEAGVVFRQPCTG